MFRIAICDDETDFSEIEKSYISAYLDNKGINYIIDSYNSGRTFIERIDSGVEYDLVFLDVQMPGVHGIDIARELCIICPAMRVAFVSAHADYVTWGYHVNAVRFILKNVDDVDQYIQECLEHVLQEMEYDNRHEVFNFTCGDKDLCINDILFIESCGNYVKFILTDVNDKGQYKIRCTATKAAEMMSKYDFIPISRKCIVNLKYVSQITRYSLKFYNQVERPISQKRYDYVKSKVMLYRGKKI